MPKENRRPDLIVYAVNQAKGSGKEEVKPYFNQVGAAWANSKDGYNIRLFALPVDGELVLLPPRSQDDEPAPR